MKDGYFVYSIGYIYSKGGINIKTTFRIFAICIVLITINIGRIYSADISLVGVEILEKFTTKDVFERGFDSNVLELKENDGTEYYYGNWNSINRPYSNVNLKIRKEDGMILYANIYIEKENNVKNKSDIKLDYQKIGNEIFGKIHHKDDKEFLLINKSGLNMEGDDLYTLEYQRFVNDIPYEMDFLVVYLDVRDGSFRGLEYNYTPNAKFENVKAEFDENKVRDIIENKLEMRKEKIYFGRGEDSAKEVFLPNIEFNMIDAETGIPIEQHILYGSFIEKYGYKESEDQVKYEKAKKQYMSYLTLKKVYTDIYDESGNFKIKKIYIVTFEKEEAVLGIDSNTNEAISYSGEIIK